MAKLVWAVDISIRQIPYAVMPHTHGPIKTNLDMTLQQWRRVD